MSESFIRYNLQLFAKEGAGGEKTEEPTSKKLDDARKEGQVAKSTELVTAFSLLSLFLILKIFVGYIGNRFIEYFAVVYNRIPVITQNGINAAFGSAILKDGMIEIIWIAVPIFISSLIVSFIVNVAQVKWEVSTKPLQPKLSKFNPIEGFKKMFSKDKLVELLKAVVKIIVVSYIAYSTLKDQWNKLQILYRLSLIDAIFLIGDVIISLGIKISAVFMFVGLADYIYQKIKFKNDMKMTKQEVKDEYKQSEGDPQIKGQIRNRMRQASQRRMMQQLPEADVVITNPTHLAVAIKYDKETAEAPIVIAKGADYLAEKIKGTARENEVEIVENKPLARMLYYNVEIGAQIPPELYQMVAEVLAYVYNLKNKL